SEIELELKRGDQAALFEVAVRLAEIAPLRPSLSRKAERGAALARNRPPAARRAPRIHLQAGLSLDDAFRMIFRSIFAHLLCNQAVAEDMRDPEGVHQLRIALRRLRAALALVAPLGPTPTLDSLRADARWLAAAIGPARNWDLFALDVLPAIGHAAPSLTGLAELAEAVGARRAAAHEAAREALTAARCGRFEIALGAWIESRGWLSGPEANERLAAPALAFAGALLARRHRIVIKRGRHFARLSPAARHRLRLALKKLRYNADFFLSLEAKEKSARRFVRRLGRLQELLGTFNDMASTPERAAELADPGLSPAAQSGLGAVIGWQARGRIDLEADLRAAWRAFRRVEPPLTSWAPPAATPPP
ncbi:MAG: CHAD domain-containing protein, partial [Acetobacteraceae bacterium]